ncbi:MAG TPA: tetratricopeptide repeat protein, partial [Steroidobacteraceae bacterium]|nr:tetratricopeptide repeat protein [Steroidobacteraceae bacterium]
MEILEALQHARALARCAEDEGAKQAYLEVLRVDPTNLFALNELGTLALAGGFRSAARTAYLQAVRHHPGNKIVRVNLANVLREDDDVEGARQHYQAALDIDPDLPEAHQGMAWALTELGLDGADDHLHRGYSGRALLTKPYRGTGAGVPLLMLVSARGGNIPSRLWIDDRRFTIHVIYADFYDARSALPPHALVVNTVGDADLCGIALARAEELLASSAAPLINAPARVRATARADNARRLASLPGVIAPRIDALPRSQLLAAEGLEYPLLLRSPGFHTGRHCVRVESRDGLARAAASLAGDELLAIQ